MKPTTNFTRQVVASNEKLPTISPKAVEWAIKNHVKHPAFRGSKGITTCGDCGQQFRYEGKGANIVCPHCGRKLYILDTRNRKVNKRCYFGTLAVVDGLQVQRVFLLDVMFKKGTKMEHEAVEVCRLWLNAQGQAAVTSRKRTLGYYQDNFKWDSEIELRVFSDVHYIISNTWIYPRYKVIPELKRNGFKGDFPDCHPFELMKALLTDTRIETLYKAGNDKALRYFLANRYMLDKFWSSYKIAMRHGYNIEDYGIWGDTLRLLEKAGRDTRSVKYICPDNLLQAHNFWLRKDMAVKRKRLEAEKLKRAKSQETKFLETKSCYFGIVIKDCDIEVSVLDSIEAYKAEGDAMHHCVFQCSYFDREDSIVLSARDRDGNRIETVEFSLTQHRVIQSHGLCNKDTELHDRIVNLVNANAHRFIEARATA